MSIRKNSRKDPLGLCHVLLKGNLGRRKNEGWSSQTVIILVVSAQSSAEPTETDKVMSWQISNLISGSRGLSPQKLALGFLLWLCAALLPSFSN
jgi:hypothetical protein